MVFLFQFRVAKNVFVMLPYEEKFANKSEEF